MNTKNWTVLIYANGNNELEPEMYRSFLTLKGKSFNNINVVMEIGRLNYELINLIRPNEHLNNEKSYWTGVRRYDLCNFKNTFWDLGNINMSDGHNLYNFISWSVKKYPAEHYMLILSGHGSSFIGGLTDYSSNPPSFMEIPTMANCLYNVKKKLNLTFDILVLDMCFMNYIEVIYELGRDQNTPIKNLITYENEAPISGICYYDLISLMDKHSNTLNLNTFIQSILTKLKYKLIAIEISYTRLKYIKKLFNSFAYYYLSTNNPKDPNSIKKYISNNRNIKALKSLDINLRSLIIATYASCNKNANLIKITIGNLKEFFKFYSKLSFSKNNYWTKLLMEKTDFIESNVNKNDMSSSVLPMSIVYCCIKQSNPSITDKDIFQYYKNLK